MNLSTKAAATIPIPHVTKAITRHPSIKLSLAVSAMAWPSPEGSFSAIVIAAPT
jgi:hypothetical protein